MKKLLILFLSASIYSCAIEDIQEQDLSALLNPETTALEETDSSTTDSNSGLTAKDTDNDGIEDEADVDVDGDGVNDNGTDTDGDGINDDYDVDVDGGRSTQKLSIDS